MGEFKRRIWEHLLQRIDQFDRMSTKEFIWETQRLQNREHVQYRGRTSSKEERKKKTEVGYVENSVLILG